MAIVKKSKELPAQSENKKSLAKQRREFVRQCLAKDKELPFSMARAHFRLESDSVLYQDAVYFRKHGEPIIAQDRKFKVSGSHLLLVQRRARTYVRAKDLIGACGAMLIAPTAPQQQLIMRRPMARPLPVPVNDCAARPLPVPGRRLRIRRWPVIRKSA